jgi:hypothetical protein
MSSGMSSLSSLAFSHLARRLLHLVRPTEGTGTIRIVLPGRHQPFAAARSTQLRIFLVCLVHNTLSMGSIAEGIEEQLHQYQPQDSLSYGGISGTSSSTTLLGSCTGLRSGGGGPNRGITNTTNSIDSPLQNNPTRNDEKALRWRISTGLHLLTGQ